MNETTLQEILESAEAEVERLKALGWKQADFATALATLVADKVDNAESAYGEER